MAAPDAREPPVMKVCMLTFSLYGYTAALAEALGRLVDLDFFCSEYHVNDEDPAVLDQLEGICNVRRFSYGRFRDPRNAARARAIGVAIRDGGYDIVHLQEYTDPWMAAAWPTARHLPLVLTVHDPYQHPGIPGLRSLYQDAMQGFYIRRASRYIVLGEAVKAALVQRYSHVDASHVFVTGIGLSSRPAEVAPPPGGTRKILFFGQVRRNKGLDVLIAAERLIRKRVADYEIVVAGVCDEPVYYQNLLDADAPVRMVNRFIPDTDVPRYFQEASLVVLPYRSATQSGIVPMAFAYGRPVVATSVGAVAEVVRNGETGLLVPPEDPEALAEALTALLNDAGRRREMGNAARKYSETHLNWQAIAQQTLAVYEDALRDTPK